MPVAPATGLVAVSANRAPARLILKIPARSAARQSRRPAAAIGGAATPYGLNA